METINVIRCMLTDIVESDYIGYWANIRNIVYDESGEDVTSFEVKAFDSDEESWCIIDENAVNIAIERMLSGEVQISSEYSDQFRGEQDEWYYDAIGADCVVQIAIFSEIVYS